jgi:hypothetical protein
MSGTKPIVPVVTGYYPVIATGQVATNGLNVTDVVFNNTVAPLIHTLYFNGTGLKPLNQTFYRLDLYVPGTYRMGYICGDGYNGNSGGVWVSNVMFQSQNVLILNLVITACVVPPGAGQ